MIAPGAIFANPLDRDAARHFFTAYEASSDHSPTEELTYLQLKCLHEASPSRWLNAVGRRCADQGRLSSAFLCYIQSLWLNSAQPEVFGLCQSLESAMRPPTLTEGGPAACTVSVIMPTYNRGAPIWESVWSVLQQTWQDFELIVVNDGGDDSVVPIIRALGDTRVRYLKLVQNQGTSAARNAGILMARGRYVAFLDDDDVFLPDHLDTLVHALADGRHKVAYGSTRAVRGRYEGGGFVREADVFVWNEPFARDTLVTRLYITTCAVMIAREVFNTVGLFTPNLHMAEDWDLWLRCAETYPFHHVEKVTCEYRLSSLNQATTDRAAAYLFGHLVTQYHLLYRGLIAYCRYFIVAGELAEARHCYNMVLARSPGYFRHYQQLEAIADLATTLGDRRTLRSVTQECFEGWPRQCLSSAAKRTSSFSRLDMLRPLLSWIFRRLRHHTRRWWRSRA